MGSARMTVELIHSRPPNLDERVTSTESCLGGFGDDCGKASDLAMSNTVANHAIEGSAGTKARPYGDSTLL